MKMKCENHFVNPGNGLGHIRDDFTQRIKFHLVFKSAALQPLSNVSFNAPSFQKLDESQEITQTCSFISQSQLSLIINTQSKQH